MTKAEIIAEITSKVAITEPAYLLGTVGDTIRWYGLPAIILRNDGTHENVGIEFFVTGEGTANEQAYYKNRVHDFDKQPFKTAVETKMADIEQLTNVLHVRVDEEYWEEELAIIALWQFDTTLNKAVKRYRVVYRDAATGTIEHKEYDPDA